MRSLAEMASVRPVSGAIMDFPTVFVDPALGFAVGFMYWCVHQTYPTPCAVADLTDQAGELHEHGHSDNSSCNVHTVLGSWLWRCSSHIHIAPGNCLDECVWCAGKTSFNFGIRTVLSRNRSMPT